MSTWDKVKITTSKHEPGRVIDGLTYYTSSIYIHPTPAAALISAGEGDTPEEAEAGAKQVLAELRDRITECLGDSPDSPAESPRFNPLDDSPDPSIEPQFNVAGTITGRYPCKEEDDPHT